MKKIYFLLCLLFTCFINSQENANPLVIFNAENIGYKSLEEILKPIKQEDIAILSVLKENGLEKYGSNSGVVVITTKKFIVDKFYKNIIANSELKKKIPTAESLAKIGIIGSKAENKNQPYDELAKYININLDENQVQKIASISFIEPSVALQMNPDWKFGAIEIMSTMDR
ncbi:hypothetical protein ACFSJW_20385 [Flavobacterium artemisiae]|uniref:Uncharacterized protein n=1 Tax=Flavobacterium artemisiae TaxID=2126556 RepID=A0ABW4HBZ6_9FLAO